MYIIKSSLNWSILSSLDAINILIKDFCYLVNNFIFI